MNTSNCCSRIGLIDDLEYAKISCAKNSKCIGIEVRDHRYFGICLDAACTSIPLNNDENSNDVQPSFSHFLKKKERYGKISMRRYFGNTIFQMISYSFPI